MNTNIYILLTVVFAGLLHSGFSLGTSMLLLLGGHHISRGRSHARLVRLTGSFVLGALAMIGLLLTTFTYAGLLLDLHHDTVFILISGASTVLSGIWVLFFYYRDGTHGTSLWIPRSFARYLGERTRGTRSTSEAFVLGTASVLYELPLTVGLIATAALQIAQLPAGLEAWSILTYSGLAIIALFILFMLIGGGHTGSSLTRWRSTHKRFLQVILGIGLIALGAGVSYASVFEVLAARGVVLW